RRAKLVFSGFVWLALILVVSVFTFFCSQTFVSEPKIVIPSLGLIPIAILTGFMMYNLKLNNGLVTIIGLGLLSFLIVLGIFVPIKLPWNPLLVWSVLLLIYCFIASVMPVQILLQPRDYLSSYLLFFGVSFGYLGLVISHPKINMPFFINLKSQEGLLWPMLFVTVACGAVSGFHSLISSGTTSKQLANERDAKKIGYGAMVLEGFVAILALLCIAGGLSGKERLTLLLSKEGPGPVGTFGAGFGNITRPVLFGFGGLIAITLLNSFILTTLDTATRVARYIAQELFKVKNRFFATLIIVILGGMLTISGQGGRIWAIFGASNQLVAALTLFVLSAWLLSRNKNVNFTFIPAIFMLLTTVGALIYQVYKFFLKQDFLIVSISVILIILAVYMVFEVLKKFFQKGLNSNV
ncbi:MAG: carbon starvation protein A, partial [Candidatus Omnitrophica bacterium]|nr:carbon starvation protein A [Candidatus Omnitrophota bacterium]